jgi:tetratricopeptide (TPR) repeat protein
MQGAADSYERATQIKPDDRKVRFAAGLFYFNARNFDKAWENLTAAEKLGNPDAELYVALSETAHFRKEEDKSRTYLEKAVALAPENKDLRRQLGISYRDAGNYDKAIELLKPLLPETRVELAACYFEKKDYESALPLLLQIAAEQPANSDYLYFLGKTQKELKRYPEAIATLQRELQLRPDDADALSTMGTTYFALQDWAHAVIFLERFIKLKPRQAFAYYAAGICYDKLGNASQALLNYNKFLEIDDGADDAQTFQARERAKSLQLLLKEKGGSKPR